MIFSPTEDTPGGTYEETSLKFLFSESTATYFELQIKATIETCKVQRLSFASTRIEVSYSIGQGQQEITLPQISQTPNCDVSFTEYSIGDIDSEISSDLIRGAVRLSDSIPPSLIVDSENFELMGISASINVVVTAN